MRPDIAKLTTEKERRGGSYVTTKKYGGKVHIVHDLEHDYEDEFGGFYSSARRGRAHGNHKEFSDVLNPLRGALRKNVGRPWDKVYSEFCQFLDRRSVSGIHIFGHLCGRGGEVKVSGLYVGEDGKVCEHRIPRYWDKNEKPVDGFYVHPVTGLLCYKEYNRNSNNYRLRAVLTALRDNEVDIGDKKYRVINGCWFEVWTQVANKERWIPCWLKDDDAEKHSHHGCRRHHKTGECGNWDYSQKYDMVVRRRSLNSKEIKMVKKYQFGRIEELEKELR